MSKSTIIAELTEVARDALVTLRRFTLACPELEQRLDMAAKQGEAYLKGVPTITATGETIPLILYAESFLKVWAEWKQYRRNRRLTCSKDTLNRQLTKLAEWEEPEEVLRQSMRNGWNGIFQLKRGAMRHNPEETKRWLKGQI